MTIASEDGSELAASLSNGSPFAHPKKKRGTKLSRNETTRIFRCLEVYTSRKATPFSRPSRAQSSYSGTHTKSHSSRQPRFAFTGPLGIATESASRSLCKKVVNASVSSRRRPQDMRFALAGGDAEHGQDQHHHQRDRHQRAKPGENGERDGAANEHDQRDDPVGPVDFA